MSKDSPEKRRGRPQKKDSTIFIQAQELFSIHDTVFHAALLFYTFHIFDKTPSRRKFNPTIGYSIYEKLKSLSSVQKQYLIEDVWAIDQAQEWKQNKPLVNFFINSMTFGPKCVVEQFYTLFKFILSLQKEPTVQNCLQFIKESGFKYMNFNCSVLELLQVRSSDHKKSIKEVIDQQIHKFILIIIHSLWALKVGKKQNNYANILESQEDLFERGTHNKGRKLIKL